MIGGPAQLDRFLRQNRDVIVAELTSVRGSSPREQGTFMVVSKASVFGTIGGGALEYMVIERARRLLGSGRSGEVMDVPLGPEIGQCCGGRVGIDLRYADGGLRARLLERLTTQDRAQTHVYVFGAGHVGGALARMMSLLPVHLHVIDTRRDELASLPPEIDAQLVPMPEAVVRNAPGGSVYVILTHDHALDFLIAAEALQRADSPYVGMVGSRTKRARFATWYLAEGGQKSALERLVLPIGGQGLGDKRPEVIAALAAAEIMVHIGQREAEIGHAQGTSTLGAMDGR